MKLKNIAKKNGKEVNLELQKERRKIITPNQEFEVSNERGKELLDIKIEGNPIVEKVKETQTSQNKTDNENK